MPAACPPATLPAGRRRPPATRPPVTLRARARACGHAAGQGPVSTGCCAATAAVSAPPWRGGRARRPPPPWLAPNPGCPRASAAARRGSQAARAFFVRARASCRRQAWRRRPGDGGCGPRISSKRGPRQRAPTRMHPFVVQLALVALAHARHACRPSARRRVNRPVPRGRARLHGVTANPSGPGLRPWCLLACHAPALSAAAMRPPPHGPRPAAQWNGFNRGSAGAPPCLRHHDQASSKQAQADDDGSSPASRVPPKTNIVAFIQPARSPGVVAWNGYTRPKLQTASLRSGILYQLVALPPPPPTGRGRNCILPGGSPRRAWAAITAPLPPSFSSRVPHSPACLSPLARQSPESPALPRPPRMPAYRSVPCLPLVSTSAPGDAPPLS